MAEWNRVKIADIAEKIAIGPFGSRMKSDCYTATGVPVIRGTNLTGGRKFSGEWVYVSEETANDLLGCNVSGGDLVFPHRGSIGEVGIVPHDRDRYLLSSSLMKLKCDPTKVYSPYLYFFFTSSQGKFELLKNASQVGTPGIGQPLSSLRNIEVNLPPLATQKRIATLLESLEDKIELNRQINQTLENIAQAMFKSWFVDFEPVKAKIAAKEAGEDEEGIICAAMRAISGKTNIETHQMERFNELKTVAELFSTSLYKSDLGWVPTDWQIGTLGQIAHTVRHQRQASELDEATNYVGLEHIPRKSLALENWSTANGLESAKSCFSQGDILFGKLRPNFHKVIIAPFDGVCSTDILVCQARARAYFGLVVMHLSSQEIIEYASRFANGAKMPRTNWVDLAAYSIAIPPEDVAEKFRMLVQPMFNQILCNVCENRNLASIRDALLPKLLSGEINVDHIEINNG